MDNIEKGKDLFDIIFKIGKISRPQSTLSELTYNEMNLLSCMAIYDEYKPKTMSELSDVMKWTKPATTQAVNRLVAKNLLQRILSDEDRRLVYVKLTDKGIELFEKAKKHMRTFLLELITRMGEKDTDALINLMNKCYKNIVDILTEQKLIF